MIWRNNDPDMCNEFVTPAGNEFEILYSPKVHKDGTIELVESGRKDLRQEINSWREQTDMSYILRSMAAGTYIPQEKGYYGDFTNMPSTMAEAYQVMLNAEKSFMELPLDVRNKFDNNYKNWLFMANEETEKFMDMMGFSNTVEEVEEEKESE